MKPKRYKYMVEFIDINHIAGYERLNKLDHAGWKLSAVDDERYIFRKEEKPDEPT